MALRNFQRIGCSILGKSCACRASMPTTAMLCAPIAKMSTKKPKPVTSEIRMFSSEKTIPVTENLSIKEKLMKLWSKYGYVAIGTYFTVYFSTLGTLFLALDFDVFNASQVGFDPVAAVHKVILFDVF